MTNNFLKVNKDFFKLELNPTEILILSQIEEYNRTTKDCFMSDEVFAAQFGVSKSTISREMKILESKGFIIDYVKIKDKTNRKEGNRSIRYEGGLCTILYGGDEKASGH